jgi:hypothetical protein
VAKAVIDFFGSDKTEKFREGLKKEKMKYTWASMVKGILDMADEI